MRKQVGAIVAQADLLLSENQTTRNILQRPN